MDGRRVGSSSGDPSSTTAGREALAAAANLNTPILVAVRDVPSAATALLPFGDFRAVNDDINVLALVKGRERYIFLYGDSQRAEALRTLGRFASNPELSFTWYDAAVLSQKVRLNQPSEGAPTFGGPLAHRMNLPQSSED